MKYQQLSIIAAVAALTSACGSIPVNKQGSVPAGEKIALIGFRDCVIEDQSDCNGSGKIATDIFARVVEARSGRPVQLISRPVGEKAELADRDAISLSSGKGFKYLLTGEVTQYYDCAPMTFRPDRAGANVRVIQASDGKVIAGTALELQKGNIGSPDPLFESLAKAIADALN